MTIALGFNCHDGIVLCTDSLDTDGYSKTRANKIWCYETQDEWGISVASAGESDFIEAFNENLAELFTGEHFDKDWLMLTLRKAINAARLTYPDLQFAAMISIFGPSPMDRRLLKVSDNSKHLGPVARYSAVGIGSVLAKFLCAQMYTLFMTVEEAAELATFIVLQCINYVEGCDSPISLVSYKVGHKAWTIYNPKEIKKVTDSFTDDSMRKSFLKYWREKTAHIVRPHSHDELQQGGFVQFRRALGLKPYRKKAKSS